MTNPRLSEAVRCALDNFWHVIAEHYPEAKTGDFPPDADATMTAQCEAAVRLWLRLNTNLEPAPLTLVGTGGGCEAWQYRDDNEHPGFYVLVTDLDDPSVPDEPETSDLAICAYSDADDDSGYWFAEQIIKGGRAGLNAFYRTAVGYEPDEHGPLPFFELLGLVAAVVLRQGDENHKAGRRFG